MREMIKKLRRTLESLSPVERKRAGKCRMCGACCRLPVRCLFLSKKNRCIIYRVRPLQCRKFPRTRRDRKEVEHCGFYFKNQTAEGETPSPYKAIVLINPQRVIVGSFEPT